MATTTVKERPILMQAPLVQATFSGVKTQTRRVANLNGSGRVKERGSHRNWHVDDPEAIKACPYGVPGDHLWVRESFWQDRRSSLMPCGEYVGYWGMTVQYADQRSKPGWLDEKHQTGWMAKRPSIFMKRHSCRLILEITEIRLQRVQEISEEDAAAEGVDLNPNAPAALTHRTSFARLWDKINGKRGFGWAVNPWIWAITFRKVVG